MRFRLAPDARVLDRGRIVIGGSPLRILRFSEPGAAAIRAWAERPAAPDGAAAARLAARLADEGVLDPVPAARAHDGSDLTVVVPTHGRVEQLAAALDALVATVPRARLVVVDDGSPDAGAVGAVAAERGAAVVRRDRAGGPAAARNEGLAHVTTAFVAFVDSDVEVRDGWLGPLLELLGEDTALAAPRVRSVGAGLRGAYEAARSPLDLGPRAGPVRAGTRVAYVPAATLVGRAAALRSVGGFDPAMEVGEDVDLCWRLVEAGERVRYAGDAAVVEHREPDDRRGWWPWWRRRVAYGTSAAPLHRRHPGSVAPLGVSGWSVVVWAAVACGHPVVGAGVAGGTAAALVRRLTGLPPGVAAGLALRGHLGAGELLARALWRPWFPLTLLAAVCSRRARRTAALALVLPAVLDHHRRHPAVGVAPWVVLCALDDLGYAAGVWGGAIRGRSLGALRPVVRAWPGGKTHTRGGCLTTLHGGVVRLRVTGVARRGSA